MSLQTELPAAFDAVVAFLQAQGGPESQYILTEPERIKNYLANGQIFSIKQQDNYQTIFLLTQRNFLTEPGLMIFPRIIRKGGNQQADLQLFDLQKQLIAYWQQQPSELPRTLIFHAVEADSPQEKLFKSLGLRLHRRMVNYALTPGPDASAHATELPFVNRALTRGYQVKELRLEQIDQDPTIADRMVALHNKLFSPRGGADLMNLEIIKRNLKLPLFRHLLLWKAEEIVGLCSCVIELPTEGKDEFYVDEILIDRPHWGSGASDLLGSAAIQLAEEVEAARLHCYVEETNYASRKLVERLGLVSEKIDATWHLEVPATATLLVS